MLCRALPSLGLLALALTVAGSASAHLTLTAPTPRLGGEEGDPELKQGPCGQATNGRTANVTTFMPGETIMVTFDEYIDHDSYYRVAFDDDGDDVFDTIDPPAGESMDSDPETAHPLSANILAYFKEGREGDNAASYSMEVTLPTTPCDNCTLQVIQYMYGSANPNYYQCADIVISGGGAGGAGGVGGGGAGGMAQGGGGTGGMAQGGGGMGGMAQGGVSGAGMGGAAPGGAAGNMAAAGMAGVPQGGGMAGSTAVAGSGGAAGGIGTTPTTSSAESGGCALTTSGSSSQFSLFALAASALLLGLSRRRRS